MTFRVLVAFFSGLIAVITTALIPFAHFGDKNETWTKRLSADMCHSRLETFPAQLCRESDEPDRGTRLANYLAFSPRIHRIFRTLGQQFRTGVLNWRNISITLIIQ